MHYPTTLNYIIHEIQTAFDSNPTVDVRSAFFDISKSFDKDWHKSLLFKLQASGVEGQLLVLHKDDLHNRKQNSSIKWSNV